MRQLAAGTGDPSGRDLVDRHLAQQRLAGGATLNRDQVEPERIVLDRRLDGRHRRRRPSDLRHRSALALEPFGGRDLARHPLHRALGALDAARLFAAVPHAALTLPARRVGGHPKALDSSARSDYERATAETLDAEQPLEQFNNKYGKDIERYAAKLIEHYENGKSEHAAIRTSRLSVWSGRPATPGPRPGSPAQPGQEPMKGPLVPGRASPTPPRRRPPASQSTPTDRLPGAAWSADTGLRWGGEMLPPRRRPARLCVSPPRRVVRVDGRPRRHPDAGVRGDVRPGCRRRLRRPRLQEVPVGGPALSGRGPRPLGPSPVRPKLTAKS